MNYKIENLFDLKIGEMNEIHFCEEERISNRTTNRCKIVYNYNNNNKKHIITLYLKHILGGGGETPGIMYCFFLLFSKR